MKLSEFDYVLPKALIAQHPLAERDASRLLLLDRASHGWEDRRFRRPLTRLQASQASSSLGFE
ncbi:MAG: hypothetical protein DMG28_10080 [Acidobacteria bacterium]|nr:MAG: hypothetical protein DMG28_10080 [Acidobacteriota bacterium]